MSGFFDPFGNSSGGGGTSSEDKVARAEIAAIKDGETLDSFSDVETALADKADITDIPTVPITAIQKNGTDIVPVSGTVNIIVPTQASDINAATATQGGKADTAIQGIKVNGSTVNPDSNKVVSITIPTSAADVSALPDTTKYAVALSLTINSSTYVVTGQLKDQNGDNLGTAQTIDLPLESVVVGGSYNSQTKKVVLTLQNGNTIEFSVADLVSGLQTELSAGNKLNPEFINYDSTHRAVSDAEKSAWNGKQNALSSAQLNVVNSKMTRKQAITNGMYLLERQPKATTNPDTGNPYIYASFADFSYDFDSVEGITLTQFGIIYCNDGTAKVEELRLENVDGIHIIKKDSRNGSNLPVSGTNPVTAVGFTQYQDSDGVTSDVLYTNDIGGDYRILNAPADIAALDAQIETNKNNISSNWGNAKNLLVNRGSLSNDNITYTWVNGDVFVTGTKASESATYVTVMPATPLSDLGLSDKVVISNNGTNCLLLVILWSNITGTMSEAEIVSGSNIIDIPSGYTHILATLGVKEGAIGTINETIQPMICTKAQWDISHEYQPYPFSNAELTVAEKQNENNISKLDTSLSGTLLFEVAESTIVPLRDNISKYHTISLILRNSSGYKITSSTVPVSMITNGSMLAVVSADDPSKIGTFQRSGSTSTYNVTVPSGYTLLLYAY